MKFVVSGLTNKQVLGEFGIDEIKGRPVLQKARTEIPPRVAEVSLSLMASPCTPVHVGAAATLERPRMEAG
jgi:hypothetical protein